MRVLVIFGTRPEAIKLAPVCYELRKRPEFEAKVCVTAQHRQLLDQALNLFDIKPDFDLDLMRENQTLFQVTAKTLTGLEEILRLERPDAVLVQGDTTTAFAAALAAYYLRVSVGHVEAGLRTGNRYNPFPEEINRKLVDALSDWCFAPTEQARQNLLAEGVPTEKVFLTGNTIIDSLQSIVRRQADAGKQHEHERFFSERYGIHLNSRHRLVLVTGHRRESFGPDLESICRGLRMIAQRNPRVCIVYPVHLNPNVQRPAREILGGIGGVHLIDPLDYSSFVWLLSRAYIVLTDSGGVQEEAPALGKPLLVLRKETERPEGIDAGIAKLVGTDCGTILAETQKLLDDEMAYSQMARSVNPYGDGHAARRVVEHLRKLRE